ncbi:unnamed protein product [Psylliodes chrysocephalus]|uniref:CRAL-TRIO domain-containing protein n=1 Tax=Psylliodes chrysocephalus TaxID=3402493 RepID=A0A9P0CXZ2_9CUCU|nr:unnamed protein product [Psylliodes chrysocephala]
MSILVSKISTKDLLITDRENIRKKWGKTKADVDGDIKIIRDWLTTQPHLPEIPSDNMIEFFLTNCKYSIEKTKQNLDMYYTIRDMLPYIYRGKNPNSASDMDVVYNTGDIIYLPKLTPELYRICLATFNDTDFENIDSRRLFIHLLANTYEVRIHEDLAMGDIYIIDFTNLKFRAVTTTTPMLLKHYVYILEKVMSNRMKQLHFLKPPSFISNLLAIVKNFLSAKLRERVITHKSVESILKYVPLELLPTDYGGEEKSIKELAELWKEKMVEYKDRFEFLDTMKVNEDLRPEKLKNDELLGYHGNFKKLDVD